MIEYPNDFKVFCGKRLSSSEIHQLIQNAIRDAGEAEPNEFSNILCSIRTGDIKVEVEEFGHILVWQQIASYWEAKDVRD